jgi:hypothetical protein
MMFSQTPEKFIYAELIGETSTKSDYSSVQLKYSGDVSKVIDKQLMERETEMISTFFQMIDALNYLNQNGWQVSSSYAVSKGKKQWHYWILKMDLSDKTIPISFVPLNPTDQFPSMYPQALKGIKVRVKPEEMFEVNGYRNFYVSFDKVQYAFSKESEHNKPFSKGKGKYTVSNYEDLAGKEFEVLQVYSMKNSFKSVLELDHPEIGTVYYEYNPYEESLFELEIMGKIQYPEQTKAEH